METRLDLTAGRECPLGGAVIQPRPHTQTVGEKREREGERDRE